MENDVDLKAIQTSPDFNEHLFQHHKLDATLMRQTIQNPYRISTGTASRVLTQVFNACPFLFSYQTKVLYLSVVQITSVDINRSLHNLKFYVERKKKTLEDPQLNDILFRSGERHRGVGLLGTQKEVLVRENLVEGALSIGEVLEPGKIL